MQDRAFGPLRAGLAPVTGQEEESSAMPEDSAMDAKQGVIPANG